MLWRLQFSSSSAYLPSHQLVRFLGHLIVLNDENFSGIAKRDTIVDDIKDSIGDALDDALGNEKKTLMEEIEDFKIEDLDVRETLGQNLL